MNRHGASIFRLNATIHFISACYWLIAAGVFGSFMPHALYNDTLFRIGICLAILLILLDITAGFKQWKRPPSGHTFSILLHLAVLAGVTAVMTYDYQKQRPQTLENWFLNGDWWFLSVLTVSRLITLWALWTQ